MSLCEKNFGYHRIIPALALILVFAINACGIKGAPLPPAENRPPQPLKVHAVSQDGKVHISWHLPAARDPQFKPLAFQVTRYEWPDADPNPESMKKSILADIEAPKAEPGSAASRMTFIDELLTQGRYYQYVISGYDDEKRFSDPYTIERFEMRYPHDKITGLKIVSSDTTVKLAWNPPPQQSIEQIGEVMDAVKSGEKIDVKQIQNNGDKFYVNVYRANGKDGQFGRSPINGKPLDVNEFEDEDAQPGKLMRYKVCAVRIDAGGMQLEGPLGLEVSAEVTDRTPPPVPLIISADAIKGGIRIRWKPVEEKALLGYWLERRIDGKFVDVSGLITVDEFTDRKLPADAAGEFVYRVVARDRAVNASYSAEQSVYYTAPASQEKTPVLQPEEAPPQNNRQIDSEQE